MRQDGEEPILVKTGKGRPRVTNRGVAMKRPNARGTVPEKVRKFDKAIASLRESYLQGNYRGMCDRRVSELTGIPVQRVYLVRKDLERNGFDGESPRSSDLVEIRKGDGSIRFSRHSHTYQMAERLASGEYSEMTAREIAEEEGVSIDCVNLACRIASQCLGATDCYRSRNAKVRERKERLLELSRAGDLETASYDIIGRMLGVSGVTVSRTLQLLHDVGEAPCLFGMSEFSLRSALRLVHDDPDVGLLRFEQVSRAERAFSGRVLILLRFLVRKGYLVIPEEKKDEKTEIS